MNFSLFISGFFSLAAESATYSHVKNAVKVFKEIGVSVCSELVNVKFHTNNERNSDISRNLFSVSLTSLNVSVEMYCGFGAFWFPSG